MRIISVSEFGPGGTSDDTLAVQRAINASSEGDAIYFPPGVWTVSNFTMTGLHKRRLSGSRGAASILKQKSGSNWATITECDDLLVDNLVLNANGVVSFGGFKLYGCRGGILENNTFYDSNPQAPGASDRYSFVLGIGSRQSEEMLIRNNNISYLQLECDFVKDSKISGNRVFNSVNTTSIGMFTVDNGVKCSNVEISDNRIIDGRGASIMVAVDPPQSTGGIFESIRILRNVIHRRIQDGQAIRIGTGNVTITSSGNRFENFDIEDNEIEYFEDAAAPDAAAIWLIAATASGFRFKNFSIKRNFIKAATGPDNVAFNIRKLEDSEICDNVMEGHGACFAIGDRESGNLIAGNIAKPLADTGWGFIIEDSAGNNRIVNNTVVGGDPTKRYVISEPNGTDLLIQG